LYSQEKIASEINRTRNG